MPAHAHGLNQLVDRAKVDTPWMYGLLDHRRERLLGRAPGLQEGGEVTPLAQLRDSSDRPCHGPGIPGPIAVAVAVVDPLRRPLAMLGAGRGRTPPTPCRRWAEKPIISRSRSASELFSNRPRRVIMSSAIVVLRLRLGSIRIHPNPKPEPRWPPAVDNRLGEARLEGRSHRQALLPTATRGSVSSYTTSGDTTAVGSAPRTVPGQWPWTCGKSNRTRSADACPPDRCPRLHRGESAP